MKPFQAMRLRSGAAGGATDPNFANVITLLHLDGADGSTTIIDSSPLAASWSASGANIAIRTAQSKFGGASVGIGSTSTGYLTATNASFAIGTGDFTVECWYRRDVGSAIYNAVFTFGNDQGLYFLSGNMLWYDGGNLCSQALSLGAFYHVAVTRSGATLRLFIDGVKATSDATRSTDYSGTTHRVGADPNGTDQSFDCYIDEVRVTKGVARYTSNFTPPTAAFPNS